MLTNARFISLLLLCCRLVSCARGATVTWGQVNKYASTLHAQDVYLPRDNNTDAEVEVYANTDVVYGLQNVDGYTITAVHVYDMTSLQQYGGDGGTAQLLSGGVGQLHATVRFKRHETVHQLPTVHFQLVIYGVQL